MRHATALVIDNESAVRANCAIYSASTVIVGELKV